MKILAIRGRNLASLEGEFDIDFTVEPLFSAGIFAISGPTGAGKSTLLDTMCLALFARTPRTNQAKENNVKLRDVNDEVLPQSDPRFMLRRGTASGYAETDFVALNGHRYRARWSVSRARDKESGRLQQPRTTLYNLDKEEEEQGGRSDLQARIIELIGLTFEQFTRSVLLAQNDFSTFLKAEQGEKASLLEKLTGTELYSAISRLIFEKNAAAKEAFDGINQRIQGIELLTEEVEEEIRTRLSAAEATLLRLDKSRMEQQALEEAVRSARQQITDRESRRKDAAVRLQKATELLLAARRDYELGMEEQQKSETAFNLLKQEIQQARRVDIQLDNAMKTVSDSELQMKRAVGSLKEADDKYQAAFKLWQQRNEEITHLAAWRERYRSKESIAEQLSALLLHIDAASVARESINKANRTILSIRSADDKQALKLKTLQQTVESKRVELSKIETSFRSMEAELKKIDISRLDLEIEQVRKEREQLLIEQARLAASGNIQELRARLQEGEPCPVCGSVHHPALSTLPAVSPDQQVAQMTLHLQQLSEKKTAYTKLSGQITSLQQKQLAFHKELTEADAACKDIIAGRKLSATQLAHENEMIKEQTVRLSRSLESADLLFGSSDWQKGWQQDPVAFRKTLTDFARQWHENNEKLRELEREQSARKAESDSLASFLPSLHKRLEETVQELEKNKEALAVLQKERSILLNGRPADLVEQEYSRRSEELKERLKCLLATQTEQAGIAEQMRGISEQIEKDLAEASANLTKCQETLDKWIVDYTGASGGETLSDSLARVTQEKTELSFRIRIQKENKEKVAGLQNELTAKRLDSERWAKLNELAGSADGAKFRRVAQGYTLDLLLNYANVQLRNLTRRYRLERVPETLALQVIDRDMCDEVRSVHSLSGGESFLVSLALALGLSSLSSNRMKVESLFIDEGFGSLDAETLRVAMDALESLRTQGRKIGVISHVQEMTERIPAQIRVNRAGNGRSYIEII